MKTSSAKAKGRRLQQQIRDSLMKRFPTLRTGDVESIGMGQSGEDIVLSPAAKDLIPFSFEAKNQESLSIWKCLEQAASNCGDRTPVLVFKRNRSETYACLPFEAFLDLISPKPVQTGTDE